MTRVPRCTHCGGAGAVEEYTLSFAPEGRDATAVDLSLCRDCLASLLAEPTVDLVAPALVRLDDGSPLPDRVLTER